jgi:hypothetical protein
MPSFLPCVAPMEPHQGYIYGLLKVQGPAAPGGAKSSLSSSSPPLPKRESTENKSNIRGVFFVLQNCPSIHHVLPRNSPQTHHQNTTF